MPSSLGTPRRTAGALLPFAWSLLLVAACAESAPSRAGAAGAPAVAGTTPNAAPSFGDEPVPAIFGCLGGDTIVYADVRIDSIAGDTVGVWISLWQAGDGVDGASLQAEDPQGRAVPLARVQLSDVDSIALDIPHAVGESDTSRFVGRASCERLWGRQRNRRETPSRPAVYRRWY